MVAVRRRPQFYSLDISFPPGAIDGVQIGASVAVKGTSLTVGRNSDFAAPRSLSMLKNTASPRVKSQVLRSHC